MTVFFDKFRIVCTVASSALLLLAASCSTEDIEEVTIAGNHSDPISFSLAQPSWGGQPLQSGKGIQTRGEAVTKENLSSLHGFFRVAAFPKGESANPYLVDDAYQNSQTWNTTVNHYWPLTGALDFYAYAPADMITPSFSSQKMGFSHEVAKDATASCSDAVYQKDLIAAITLDRVKSQGNVPLTFEHALSAIYFKSTAKSDDGTIESIALKNVYGKGSAVFGKSAGNSSYTWTPDTESKTDYTQSFNAPTGTNTEVTFYNDATGKRAFMLIPQSLRDDSMIEVTFKDSNDKTAQLTANLKDITPDGCWSWGKAYTYILTINQSKMEVTSIGQELGPIYDKSEATDIHTGKTNSNEWDATK